MLINKNEKFSALKKEKILSYAMIWMNLKEITLSKIRQSQKPSTSGSHFCEVSEAVKRSESGNRTAGAGGGGKGEGGVVQRV